MSTTITRGQLLRTLIRDVLDTTSLTDPREVAAKVIAALDPADYVHALEEALPEYVRTEMNRAGLLSPKVDVSDVPMPQLPARSPRGDRLREYARRRLEVPIFVGDGQRKRLGDCTRDELLRHVAMLYDQVEKTSSKARWYERVAAAIPDGGVVRDIRPEVFRAL